MSCLELVKQTVGEINDDKVTIVECGQYKCRHKLHGGSNREEISPVVDPT